MEDLDDRHQSEFELATPSRSFPIVSMQKASTHEKPETENVLSNGALVNGREGVSRIHRP